MARLAPSSIVLISGLLLLTAGWIPHLGGEALAQKRSPGKTAAKPKPADAAGPLSRRLEQLEEQIVDLQVVIGTLQSLAKGQGAATGQGAAAAPPGATAPSPAGSGLATRVDVIETQISALTGQIAQLTTQLAGLEARLGAAAPGSQATPKTTSPATGRPQRPAGARAPVRPAQQPFGAVTVTPGQGRQPAAQPVGPGTSAPPVRPGTVRSRPLPAPSGSGRPGQVATAGSGAARAAYEAAYGHMLRRDYRAAESGFRQFLQSHPDDANASSAQYWLGESYFLQGQYRKAATAFLQGYRKDRGGNKAPDSLLKLGMSLHHLGEKDAACATLSELTNKFPAAPPRVKQRAAAERRRVGC